MDRRDRFAMFGTGPLDFVTVDDGGRTTQAFVLDLDCYEPDDLDGVDLDDEGRLRVPFRWGVCGTCNGEGKHVNPSIDAHGITAEEWERDWDPEEREGYMRGDYDVECAECHGRTTVPVPDLDALSPVARRLVDDAIASHDDCAAIQAAEMRFGA